MRVVMRVRTGSKVVYPISYKGKAATYEADVKCLSCRLGKRDFMIPGDDGEEPQYIGKQPALYMWLRVLGVDKDIEIEHAEYFYFPHLQFISPFSVMREARFLKSWGISTANPISAYPKLLLHRKARAVIFAESMRLGVLQEVWDWTGGGVWGPEELFTSFSERDEC